MLSTIKRVFSWKLTLLLSLISIVLLNVFSFYGLYTNKFYFFKVDNYIFPILSLVHLVFLYVMWFKIRERELSDVPMRNLEYGLYIVSLVYLFKIIETLITLLSYSDYENHLIPVTFLPIGILMFVLYTMLFGLTFLTYSYRKQFVGTYVFDDRNQHIDTWNS
ncbi:MULTISPECIES: hypothetical protein [Maribacter]|uniref:Uncharacterized protein n=1 Tax=Maribacter flavus TaxID=1658664 RepID=A0ABU7IJW6_9FLAO|nr:MULTISPECIES: hypothetical protein [Maribacter]MDC6405961.1 hypothetical protein [Maribacter sp. PR66]MEE1973254.1 hypothetical protein [Maribacter flavus]